MESLNPDSDFTAYHMKCINGFRWTALTRSVIRKDTFGNYFIKPSPFLCQLVYYIYFVNTSVKLVFLLLLVTDHLGPLEFLDRICGFDYLLCGAMIISAYILWRRYPLYEIIYSLWIVENRIYHRLGSPREIKWASEESHSVTVWAHILLACLGCVISVPIQFYEAPKYCVYTYSLLEADNSILRFLFCVHESLFLSHAWFSMTCNMLCSFEAVNLSALLKQMSKAVNELAQHQSSFFEDGGFSLENDAIVTREGARRKLGGRSHDNDVVKEEDYTERSQAFRYNNDHGGETIINSISVDDDTQNDSVKRSRLKLLRNSSKSSTSLSSSASATSRGYSFRRILYDYQQLMLASEMFNAWVGYKIVGLTVCAFCQYISSTTMAFQVLRSDEFQGIGDIWFYIQDCTVAIYVTFRVFDYMSIVLPASNQFMDSVRRYAAAKGGMNPRLRKFKRTLRPVSLKVGPNPWRREAVLDTMQMLAGYYVCVALW